MADPRASSRPQTPSDPRASSRPTQPDNGDDEADPSRVQRAASKFAATVNRGASRAASGAVAAAREIDSELQEGAAQNTNDGAGLFGPPAGGDGDAPPLGGGAGGGPELPGFGPPPDDDGMVIGGGFGGGAGGGPDLPGFGPPPDDDDTDELVFFGGDGR